MIKLPHNLKALRTKQRISQQSLADKLFISRASLAKYEGGIVILPIQVDKQGENVIEVVPHAAQAGYTGMYSDPGFIESLDRMALPFQELHGKCRAFPIAGDSMPPYGDGSYVIGRYMPRPDYISEGKRYVLLSRDEGIVFKRLYRDPVDDNLIHLHSDNPKYRPFSMHLQEVHEIWEFVAAISFGESSDNNFAKDVMTRVEELQQEVQKLADQLAFT